MALSRVSTCSLISSESIGKRLNKWANKRLKNPSTSREKSQPIQSNELEAHKISGTFFRSLA